MYYTWLCSPHDYEVLCFMVQCGMVQYAMVQYGMVQYGTIWYGIVQYGMVRYGIVWYGMVDYGTVWYSTVQYGTVRYRTKVINVKEVVVYMQWYKFYMIYTHFSKQISTFIWFYMVKNSSVSLTSIIARKCWSECSSANHNVPCRTFVRVKRNY